MAVKWKDGYRGDLNLWWFYQLCFCSVWGRCPAERGEQTLICAQLSAQLRIVRYNKNKRYSSPRNENVMFICLPPGHPRCRWLCFFSRTQIKIFNSNVAVCQSYNGSQWDSRPWERKNKLNPVAWENTVRSKDTKRSICAWNWTVFISFVTSDLPQCPTVLSAFTKAACDASSGIIDACAEVICHTYTSLIVYTVMRWLLWTLSLELPLWTIPLRTTNFEKNTEFWVYILQFWHFFFGIVRSRHYGDLRYFRYH